MQGCLIMEKIENTNSSNEKILNLFNQIKSGIIKLAPDFQRKLVWSDIHKENFIETILKGYPFPEIYIADGKVDLNNPTKIEKWIVDGQQRLSTIVQYINGDENLKLKRIPSFKNLTDEGKERFYYYNVVIRNLGRLSESAIKEVFKRINSVNYALNAIEITNALYDGAFINTANEILEKNKKIIERLDIFSITETTRMRDLEFIITLMSIYEEKGYFTTTQRNEFYVKEYNDVYNNSGKIIKLFTEIFDIINAIVDDSYSLWTKKSNFLTLFIELIHFSEDKDIKTNKTNKIKRIIKNFEKTLLKNKSNKDSIYNKYYLSSIQSTGSKFSRITRGKILQEFLIKNYQS